MVAPLPLSLVHVACSQGCGGSKPEDGSSGAGGVPKAQEQGDAAKDAAAAEIQAAAADFMKAKKADDTKKAQDEAAADIQGAAASYLAKKRAAEAPAPAADSGGGILGGLLGMFSQRDPPSAAPAAAPAPAPALASVAEAPAPAAPAPAAA